MRLEEIIVKNRAKNSMKKLSLNFSEISISAPLSLQKASPIKSTFNVLKILSQFIIQQQSILLNLPINKCHRKQQANSLHSWSFWTFLSDVRKQLTVTMKTLITSLKLKCFVYCWKEWNSQKAFWISKRRPSNHIRRRSLFFLPK